MSGSSKQLKSTAENTMSTIVGQPAPFGNKDVKSAGSTFSRAGRSNPKIVMSKIMEKLEHRAHSKKVLKKNNFLNIWKASL